MVLNARLPQALRVIVRLALEPDVRLVLFNLQKASF